MSTRPTSEFSRVFSLCLRGFMEERHIESRDVARHLGRSAGYVSEHTSGTRAPDTDLLDAVADLAGIDRKSVV